MLLDKYNILDLVITKILKNIYYYFFFLYLTLIIGFILNENSIGGAISDFSEFWRKSVEFANNFINTFETYHLSGHRQSPIFLIWQSIFIKFNVDKTLYRLLNLHLCLLLVFLIFKTLKIIFNKEKNNKLLFFSSLILLSPTFRSAAVWPDSYIYALIFFILSINFYLKFEISNNKKLSYCLMNIIFLALSSYITPNFSLFSIFFFYKFFNHYKLSLNIIFIILLNLFLSFPAFYFLFLMKINFLIPSGSSDIGTDIISAQNFSNKILITSTIIFFHFLNFGFFFFKEIKKNFQFKKNILILITIILLTYVLYFNFDYKTIYNYLGGGGLFLKISYKINNEIFFIIASIFSLFCLTKIIQNNYSHDNLILLIVLFLFQPQTTTYHSYFEPLLIMLIPLLFKFKMTNFFKYNNNLIILLIANLFFLLANFLKNFL
jgi:hypothetical protein